MGRAVAACPKTHYVHEPFNSKYPVAATSFRKYPFWRPCESSQDDEDSLRKLDNIFKARPGIPSVARSDWSSPKFTMHRILRTAIPSLAPRLKRNFVLKDPLAVCSTDVLAKRYDMKVVILVRDPVEVVSSVRRYGWSILPSRFIGQESLSPFIDDGIRSKVEKLEPDSCFEDRIAMVAYSWLITHRLLEHVIPKIDCVEVVSHADLTKDPMRVVNSVVERLGMDFSGSRMRFLDEHCKQSAIKGQGSLPHPGDVRRTVGAINSKTEDMDEKIVGIIRAIAGESGDVVARLQRRNAEVQP